jgi:dihydrofolate synthase/folylpolyglutamate synthase
VNYKEALAWLYATQKFGIKLGLENTQRLLGELHVGKTGRVVHVAGTNGKGSVCAMIDSICRAARYRTGLFTSPHLISFRERVRVNGEMISEEDVAGGLTTIRKVVETWDPHPTFFEITTVLALHHFQNTGCEITVLETGMGGRLDATNSVVADVSTITPIDFDHQKWLGHSLTEIATEKAGIIKQGTPVISAAQRPEAKEVIARRAAECAASLQWVMAPWTESAVGLHGSHQKFNAALAVAAVHGVRLAISDRAIACGLASVHWPARFQFWDKRIVIDGAHNLAGAEALVQTWREKFGDEQATVLLAILRDKNAEEIIRILQPIASEFILPQIRSERAIRPNELSGIISRLVPSLPYSIAGSTAEAIASAQKRPTLITGSLHFAGEALAFLQGRPATLEECAQ